MDFTCLKKEKDGKGGYRAYAIFDYDGVKVRKRFGKWGKPETRKKYKDYLFDHTSDTNPPVTETTNVTVAALVKEFLDEVKPSHMKYGKPTSQYINYKYATELLVKRHEELPANQFSCPALDKLRTTMVDWHLPVIKKDKNGRVLEYSKEIKKRPKPLSTKTVNEYIKIIKQIFGWGVPKGYVTAEVAFGLTKLTTLDDGELGTVPSEVIQSVHKDHVIATRQQCNKIHGDMFWIQYLCAMRSEGVRLMRLCDIDRSEDIWVYSPPHHKTEGKGKSLNIAIDPEAQDILTPYIEEIEKFGSPEEYIFSPEKTMKFLVEERRKRKTIISLPHNQYKANTPKRQYNSCYSYDSYKNLIDRAIKRAGVPAWTSHQLRHLRATEVYEDHGEEAVMTLLGHGSIKVTRLYIDNHSMSKKQKNDVRNVMRKINESKKTA